MNRATLFSRPACINQMPALTIYSDMPTRETSPKGLTGIWEDCRVRKTERITTIQADHVFGPKALGKHKLAKFLTIFQGDPIRAYKALERATQNLADANKVQGIFETTVTVYNITITVRGRVLHGTAKVSTAFIP